MLSALLPSRRRKNASHFSSRWTARRRKFLARLGLEPLEERRLLATLDIDTADHLTGTFADLTITRVASDYHFTDATDPISLTGDASTECTTIAPQQVSCPVSAVSSIDITGETIVVAGDVQVTGDLSLLASKSGTSGSDDVIASVQIGNVLIEANNLDVGAEASLVASETGSNFERIAKLSLSLEFAVESNATVTLASTTVQAAGNVNIHATTLVDAQAHAEADANPNTDRDASTAIALLKTAAVAEITGSTSIALGGGLQVTANNQSEVAALSDGSANGPGIGGVALALSSLDSMTRASLADSSTVTGATSVDVTATTHNQVKTDAIATAKGAVQGTPGDTRSEAELVNHAASTADGPITHAAAVALADITESTAAFVSTAGNVTSTGPLNIRAFQNGDVTTFADGSAVESSEAGVGVGVAVALNNVASDNRALLGGTGSISIAGPVHVEVNQPVGDATSEVRSEAISGAGAATSIAGSLAANVHTQTSEALVESGATVDLNGGDLVLLAGASSSLAAKAVAEGNEDENSPGSAGSAEVGVGASVALNISNKRTRAAVDNGATPANVGNATLDAEADYLTEAFANGGVQADTAFTPVFAGNVLNHSTESEVATGNAWTVGGSLSVQAVQDDQAEARAQGDVDGVNAAVGVSLALTVAQSAALASLSRDVTAGGAILVNARGTGNVKNKSLASATGAEGDDGTSGTADDDGVNDQVDGQQAFVDQFATNQGVAGSSGTASPSAESSDGTMSVAAAIAVNVLDATAQASIADGVTIVATDELVVDSSQNVDSSTVADGSTTHGATGVGAAAALNFVNLTNRAAIEPNADVTADGVTLSATMQDVSGDETHGISSLAKSGASADNVGVAGALALQIITNDTAAVLTGGSTTDASGGDVTLLAESTSDVTAEALPQEDGTTGESVGVGASVAIHIVDNATRAELEDASVLTGADDLTLTALSDHTTTTRAVGGAEGGTAITPVVAISLVNSDAVARLGTASGATTVTGNMALTADHVGLTNTHAEGDAEGANAAFGASLALATPNDMALATTLRDLSAGGTIDFTADAHTVSIATSTASATGAEGDDGVSGSSDDDMVEQQVQSQLDAGNTTAAANGAEDSGTSTAPEQETSDGKLSVAAAITVNLVDTVATASISDGVTLVAGGELALASQHNADAKATADGSTAHGATGIAAAVAYNRVDVTNRAAIEPSADVTADGVTLSATMQDVSGDETHGISSLAKSGASADNVGVAGALALQIITNDTAAVLTGNSTTNASGGDVALLAESTSDVTAEALPQEDGTTGESVGVGASVAIHIVDNATRAELEDSSVLTGADDLTLTALSHHTTTTRAVGGAEGGTAITPVVAISLVNSDAVARLGTASAATSVTGNVALTADHVGLTNTHAEGDAEGANAAFGASLALATPNDTALATTLRDLSAGGTVDFTADAHTVSVATSSASATGAEGDDGVSGSSDDDMVEQQVQSQLDAGNSTAAANGAEDSGTSTAPDQETSDGKLSVAAAITVNLVDTVATASISDGVTLVAGGELALASQHNADAEATADGSTANSATGIAAAVAYNRVDVINRAAIEPSADVTADGVTLTATMQDVSGDETHGVSSLAKSGASADNVGVAGALALQIITNDTAAVLTGNSTTNASGGDVTLLAESTSDVAAQALPQEDGTTGESVGVGASVAIHIVDNATRAELEDSSVLTGADDLTLTALSDHTTTTRAVGGAEGGTAITPVVAISLVNSDAVARLGTASGTTSVTGNVALTADHVGLTNTHAEGDAEGANAAFGASLALATPNDTALATTLRDLSAGGTIDFTADAHTVSVATSSASATGAEGDDGVSGSSDDDMVEQQVQSQLDAGNTTAAANGAEDSGTSTAPDQETSDGKLSVAAAITVNLVDTVATASISDGVTLVAGGELALASQHNADAEATADGSTANGATGIAAAVAYNRVDVTNRAAIEPNADVTAGGVTLSATMQDVSGDETHGISSLAKSGASADNVGVAGSLALQIITNDTAAVLTGGSTTDASGGDVTLLAESTSDVTAEALPQEDGTTGESVGVGASVAIHIVDNVTRAELEDASVLTGADDLTLTALSDHTTTTRAVGGAEGGTAITPVVAISLVNSDAVARLGTASGTTSVTGNVALTADHVGLTNTHAEGDAEGANAAFGASLALATPNDTALATTLRDLSAGGTVDFTADAHTVSVATSTASATGAEGDDGVSGSGDDDMVEQQVQSQLDAGNTTAAANGAEDSGTSTAPEQETSDGKLSVAAAITVNLVDTVSTASISDGVTLVAGGELLLASQHNADAEATADGSTAHSATGIAAAVAYNRVDVINRAAIEPSADVTADGVTLSATMQDVSGDETHDISSLAKSGASADNVGVAGSLALQIITNDTAAVLTGGSTTDASGDDVTLLAESTSDVTAQALPQEDGTTGESVGVGASVAIHIVDNATRAELEDASVLTGADDLTLTALSNHTTTTRAVGGAEGGTAITPVVAISLVNSDAVARLGTASGTTSVTGNVALTADHVGLTNTHAEGDAEGRSAAIGAALALALVNDTVEARIDRDLTAGGSVSVVATSHTNSKSDALASAQGAKPDDGVPGSPDDNGVNNQVAAQRSFADGLASTNAVGDSGSASTPSAETSDGPVSVAAAVSVNLVTTRSESTLADGVTLVADGSVTVFSEHNADAATNANGSATNSKIGIGAAVALTRFDLTNTATIGSTANVSADGVKVRAVMNHVPPRDQIHRITTHSVSGAGAARVGVAGSVAIALIDTRTAAEVLGGATVTFADGSDPDTSAGPLQIELVETVLVNTTASPATTDSNVGNVGVGASFALNRIDNQVQAAVQDGADLNGTPAEVRIESVSTHTVGTHAEAGAQGEITVAPAVALSIIDNDVDASLGTGNPLSVAGDVLISARHVNNVVTNANADAASDRVGVGASVTVAVIEDQSDAAIRRDVTAMGDVTVQSLADVVSRMEAKASQRGNSSSGNSADNEADHQVSGSSQTGVSSGSLPQASDAVNDADAITSAQAGTGTGGVGVAAAVAVNLVNVDSTATIADGLSILADGQLAVLAQRHTDAITYAIGNSSTADDSSNVAAAVALNSVTTNNRASVGVGAFVEAGAIVVSATVPEKLTDDLVSHALAGGVATGKAGIAGAVAINLDETRTDALLGATSDVTSQSTIDLTAQNNLRVQTVAGGLGTGEKAGIGAAVAVTVIGNETDALVGDQAAVDAVGAVSLRATSSVTPHAGTFVQDPFGFAAGGGASSGGAGLAGSVVVNDLTLTTRALVEDGVQLNQRVTPGPAQDLLLHAADATRIKNGAGALGAGIGTVGVGAAVDVTLLDKDTIASIGESAVVSAARDVTLNADSDEIVLSFAAAAGLGASTGVAGAAVVHVPRTSTRGSIDSVAGGGSQVHAGRRMRIAADNTADYDLYAGALGVGLNTASVGASNTTLLRDDDVLAFAGPESILEATGDEGLIIQATSQEDVLTIAVGGSGAGGAGIAGSATVNDLNERTWAYVDTGSRIDATGAFVEVAPGITIAARDATRLFSLAGALGAGGSVGIGAGADVGLIDKNTQAFIAADVVADADNNIIVDADSSEDLASISAAAGIGGSVGIMGSASVYTLDITTRAFIGDDPRDEYRPTAVTDVHARNNIHVNATDTNEVDLIVGNVGGAGSVSVGAAGGVTTINKTVESFIGDEARVTADALGKGITAKTGGFRIIFKEIDRPRDDEVGLPYVGQETRRDANQDGVDDLNDPSFTLQRSVTPLDAVVQGLAVTAINRDDIESIVVSGSGAGGVAVNVAGGVNVGHVDTSAYIGRGAIINGDLAAAGDAQSVLVAACSDYYRLGISGVAAGAGTVAVGPGVDVGVTHYDTTAEIRSAADVNARRDVLVIADAEEDTLSISAGLAVSGTVSIAGGVSTLKIDNNTRAEVGRSADVDAGGNVLVAARDDTDADMFVGAASVGIAAGGLSGSVGVIKIQKNTEAVVAFDAEIDAAGFSGALSPILSGSILPSSFGTTTMRGVAVQAHSNETIQNMAVAGGGGVYFGIAGGVTVTTVESETTAEVDRGARINTSDVQFSDDQSVNVSAANKAEVVTFAGGISGGFVGLAGGIDVGHVRNDVTGHIDIQADVRATRDIDVNALSIKDVDSFTISGTLGVVGLAASVSVWSLGTPLDPVYTDQNNSSATDALQSGSQSADTYAGQQVANSHSPISSILGGYSSGGSPNDALVDSAMQSTSGSVAAGSPTQSEIVNAINDPTTPLGVRAIVSRQTNLVAGNDIDIRALEDIEFDVTAGGVGVGAVGGGASVVVAEFASNTLASLGGTAWAGDDITIQARLDEWADGTALAGGLGFVALGAAVNQIKDFSTQRALIDNSAEIINADDVLVTAAADQRLLGEAGQAQIGAGALGAAFNRLLADGSTRAYVGNARIGQDPGGTVNDLRVATDVDVDADADATAIVGGLGLAGTANFAYADATPVIQAFIQAGAAVDVAGDAVVESRSVADADAELFGFTVGGVTIGTMFTRVRVQPDIDTYIGTGADVTAAGGDIVVRALHNFTTGGTPINHVATAYSEAPGGGVGAFNGAFPKAYATPRVDAFVAPRTLLEAGGDVIVEARANNPAHARADAFTIGVIGGGASLAESQARGIVRAHLDGTVRDATDVVVRARNDNRSEADAEASSFGVLAGNGATADADGRGVTYAYVPSIASVNARDNLTIESLSDNTADSDTNGAAGGVLAIGLVKARADASPSTAAYLAADVQVGGTARIAALGDDRALATTDAANGGILAGRGSEARADTRPVVRAYITPNTSVNAGRDIEVLGQALADADAVANGVSGGVFQVGLSDAYAYARPILDAYAGDNTVLRAERDVSVTALHNYQTNGALVNQGARAEADAASGQLIGIDGAEAEALALAYVDAYLQRGVTVSAGGTLDVTARSFHDAQALAEGDTFGLAVKGSVDANADARGTIRAFADDQSDLTAGDVRVLSLGRHQARADADAATGGVFSFKGAESTATAQPLVEAYIDDRGDVVTRNSVDVKGIAQGKATSDATGRGGGILDVGSSAATSTWNPTVDVYLGEFGEVRAGGDVGFQGFINHTEAGSLDASQVTRADTGSSQGALLGSSGAVSVTYATQIVGAHTERQSVIDAGRDVLIGTRSANLVGALSNGQAFGFATKGRTESRTWVNNQSRVTAGRDSEIHSGRDVTLSANSDIRVLDTTSIGGAGGLVNITGADVRSTVNNQTHTLVDDNALVCAQRHVVAEAITSLDVNADVSVETAAAISGNESRADVDIISSTTVDIQNGALVHAITGDFTARARVIKLHVDAESYSKSLAAINITEARTYVDVNSLAKVYVRTGADIYAGSTIALVSRHDNVDSDSIARARIVGFTGTVRTHAHHDLNMFSDICVESGSSLNAPNFVFDSFSPSSGSAYNRVSDATGDTVVNYVVETIETVKSVLSNIPLLGWIIKQVLCLVTTVIEVVLFSDEEATTSGDFNSNNSVTIDGDVNQTSDHQTPCNPTPPPTGDIVLEIAPDGSILANRNIIPRVSDDAVNVPDIRNAPLGQVLISAPNGDVSGNGTFRLRNRFQHVTIVNQSDLDLLLGDIQLQPELLEPHFSVTAGHNDSTFNLLGPDKAPSVTLLNEGAGSLVLGGEVSNPEGETRITSSRGGIQARGEGSIQASSLDLQAGEGDVGTPDSPLRLRPVVSQSSGPIAVSGDDVYVSISAVGYQAPEAGQSLQPLADVQLERLVAREELDAQLLAGSLFVGSLETDPIFIETSVPAGYAAGEVHSEAGDGTLTVSDQAVLTEGRAVRADVVVTDGGAVSPEGDRPVTTGDLQLQAGSQFVVQVSDRVVDQVSASGTVVIDNAALELSVDADAKLKPGDSYVIIENDADDPVRGEFAELPEGAIIELGPPDGTAGPWRVFEISYRGGDGNDVELQYRGHAGGPYAIREGDDLLLEADVPRGDWRVDWDVDGDGAFAEGVQGTRVRLSWRELTELGVGDGPRQGALTVRVSNAVEQWTANVPWTVENVAPQAEIEAADQQPIGQLFPVLFLAANEPSEADRRAGFDYDIDFGDGTTQALSGQPESIELAHAYDQAGMYEMTLTVTDKDGGSTSTTHQVVVGRAVAQDGNVLVFGGNQSDFVTITSAGAGRVRARVGNEYFGPFEVSNRVIVYGNDGDDRLVVAGNVVDAAGRPVPVEFYGGAGNDYLAGGLADDLLVGGPGDDRLLGGEGNNRLFGDGSELDANGIPLEAPTDGDDQLAGRAGHDILFGGGGNDRLIGSGGDDYLHAGSGDDRLDGGNDSDVLVGAAGDDNASGSWGNDLLLGGTGRDRLYGQADHDVLLGGDDIDRLLGDSGRDLLVGGGTSLVSDASSEAVLRAILADWLARQPNVPTSLGALAVDGALDELIGGRDGDVFHNRSEDNLRDLRDADGDVALP